MKRFVSSAIALRALLFACLAVLALVPGHPLAMADHRQSLLGAEGDWYSSYRALVAGGPPGWEQIVAAEFDLDKDTRHLRQPVDLGGLPDEVVQSFDEFRSASLNVRLEDEAWATAYARECVAAYEDRVALWIPQWVATLRAHRDRQPGAARMAIANLRAIYGCDLGFPWNGPADAQRAAIDRWIAFCEGPDGIDRAGSR